MLAKCSIPGPCPSPSLDILYFFFFKESESEESEDHIISWGVGHWGQRVWQLECPSGLWGFVQDVSEKLPV